MYTASQSNHDQATEQFLGSELVVDKNMIRNKKIAENNDLRINKKSSDNKIETENENELIELLTPYSSSYQSNQTLTSSLFLYDSDYDEDCHGSINYTGSDESDDDDDDDEEEEEELNIDGVPLIHRLTPPPPLLTNDLNSIKSDDEYDDYDYDYDEYDEIPSIIPSLQLQSLTLSKSSPDYQPQTQCSIFELCNTVTPNNSCNDDDDDDNDENEEMDDYYDDNGCPKYSIIIDEEEDDDANNYFTYPEPRKNKPKSFNFSNAKPEYYLNDYLCAHIVSLIDPNLSE